MTIGNALSIFRLDIDGVHPIIAQYYSPTKDGFKLRITVSKKNKIGADGRDGDIISSYISGKTLHEIGIKYNLTRQRVQQILKRNGIARHDGGINAAVHKEKRANKRAEHITGVDVRSIEKYGINRNDMREINKTYSISGRSPLRLFNQQRNNARIRGVQWDFDFYGWWLIWMDSGKWFDRGRGKNKYVMARFEDDGPYSKDNVKIILSTENNREGILKRYRSLIK